MVRTLMFIFIGSALHLQLGCQKEEEVEEEQPLDPPPVTVHGRMLAVSAVSHDVACVAGDSLWCSENGGSSWARYAVPQPLAHVKALPDHHVWATGEQRGIFHSSDGGSTWMDVSPGAPVSGPAFALDFVDAEHGCAMGYRWIAFTADGRASWRTRSHFDTVFWHDDIDALSENEAWLTGDALRRTTDGGLTWLRCDTDTIPDTAWWNGYFPMLSFFSSTTGWAIKQSCLWESCIYLYDTHDGGATWTGHYLSEEMQGITEMIRTGEWTGWARSRSKQLFHTANGGADWTTHNLPCLQDEQREDWCSVYQHDMDFVDDNWGWTVGEAYPNEIPCVMRTTDGGSSWTVQ